MREYTSEQLLANTVTPSNPVNRSSRGIVALVALIIATCILIAVTSPPHLNRAPPTRVTIIEPVNVVVTDPEIRKTKNVPLPTFRTQKQEDAHQPARTPSAPNATSIESGDAERNKFAHLILRHLNAPAHPNAVAFLIAWQASEGCGAHNPLCRLDQQREKYQYATADAGARIVAVQLDANHPERPPQWRASYPRITAALRNAHEYENGADIAIQVSSELRTWCGQPTQCGDTSNDPYPARVAKRAEQTQENMS